MLPASMDETTAVAIVIGVAAVTVSCTGGATVGRAAVASRLRVVVGDLAVEVGNVTTVVARAASTGRTVLFVLRVAQATDPVAS